MVSSNKVEPSRGAGVGSVTRARGVRLIRTSDTPTTSSSSRACLNEFDSLSLSSSDELSYCKLREFNNIDPTLNSLLVFLNCFGLTVNFVEPVRKTPRRNEVSFPGRLSTIFKITFVTLVFVISSQVVYDTNLRQSKLLAQQKRAAPLLTFIIVAYSWSTVVIPAVSNFFLILIGSHLFRFHSRTMATVCDGLFYGKKTFVDGWLYYLALILIAFLDAFAQLVLLGVWPPFISSMLNSLEAQKNLGLSPPGAQYQPTTQNVSGSYHSALSAMNQNHLDLATNVSHVMMHKNLLEQNGSPKIHAYLLDQMLGEEYAHGNLGVCLKGLCLMIQFVHSYAFFMVVSCLANHYATVIENINENLDKYESRKLLKQLIVLRNSSEQISLIISLPFSLVLLLVFTRQIALIGVLIQGGMQTYLVWAICIETITSGLSMFMVFNFCDGLQAASKQTHRLKTYQSVIDDETGGDQSIYEFLDYLNRLSKSIRITFFNVVIIDKHTLVSLYSRVLTLTFLTS